VYELLGVPAVAGLAGAPSGEGGRHEQVIDGSAIGESGQGGGRSSWAPTVPLASVTWWTSLAALEEWVSTWPGRCPDPESDQAHEASLGRWLSAQVEVLASGDLPRSRRSQLLRLLPNCLPAGGARGQDRLLGEEPQGPASS
jgi:hypothetical protein